MSHLFFDRLAWDNHRAAHELQALSLTLNPDPAGKAEYPAPPESWTPSRSQYMALGCLRDGNLFSSQEPGAFG